jgi:hypothetical protein
LFVCELNGVRSAHGRRTKHRSRSSVLASGLTVKYDYSADLELSSTDCSPRRSNSTLEGDILPCFLFDRDKVRTPVNLEELWLGAGNFLLLPKEERSTWMLK